MEERKMDELMKKHEEYMEKTDGHIDVTMAFVPGQYVMERLGISEKTLIALAESGEFELGRVAGRIVVNKASLLAYLDKFHFMAAESEDDVPAFDNKGRIKKRLTLVKEKHTEIPELKKISEFAIRMYPPMDDRTFIRHCDIGTFYHYRIGTAYKMSEEDFVRSCEKITRMGQKSNRGSSTKKKAGRPSTIFDKIPKMGELN